MALQHLCVIGEPIPCDRTGCDEPAVVYLREQSPDGTASGITYCETCWLQVRRAVSPLTAHDAAAAASDLADDFITANKAV